MRRIKFLLFSCALLVAACNEDAYDVTPESIAARVAELGAGEELALTFEHLGLATFGGDDDFEQEFTVTARRVEDIRVVLGGEVVPEARVAASLTSKRIQWTDQDSVSVVSVGPGSDPMNAWLIWRGATGKILFLVDARHGDRFHDIARRMGEPVTGLQVPEGQDMVAVLAPEGLNVPGRGGVVPSFRVEGSTRTETREMVNVVGLLPGRRANEMVVFSASRDHVSGTAAVLELARYYARRDRPERTLVFVIYAERTSEPESSDVFSPQEDLGPSGDLGPPGQFGPPEDFGARHFTFSIDPEHVVALVHVDRIGERAKGESSEDRSEGANDSANDSGEEGGNESEMPAAAWITGYDRSTLSEILQPAFAPDPYPWFNLFELLGNAPMAARGVVAHAVGTSPVVETGTWYPDVNAPERLDPSHMARVIQAIATSMRPVVEAEATPERLDR